MISVTRVLGGVLFAALGGLGVLGMVLAAPVPFVSEQLYGVTFSQLQATSLELDWRVLYEAILTDLGAQRLRLVAYWPLVEPSEGVFDFTDLDYQMDRAAEEHAAVILVVGRKVPRWPECHEPTWLKDRSELERQEAVLAVVHAVVGRYRDHPALAQWQLENEPLLDFGVCPPEDRAFLRREEALVRRLDSSHPILITDSGELNSWLGAAQFGDRVGTTMYRTVHSRRTGKPFHYDYLFPSWLYRLKARVVWLFTGKSVLISELQGEPWGAVPFSQMTHEQRRSLFSPERFMQLHNFARRTQFSEAYWWGVEYWYWEREQGDAAYWDYAHQLF